MRPTAVLMICVTGAVYGQPAAPPQFEVASVKPSSDPSNAQSGGKTGKGRVNMINMTLKRCIMGAYGLGPNQIVGGPDWLDADRFEIVAKAEQPVDDDALMTMLQTLLAERFKLAVHRDTRTVPAFVLEVVNNRPKLEKAEAGESSTQNGRGLIAAKASTMAHFAEVLSRQMDRPVVNQTGLDGVFNLKLQWTPDVTAANGVSIFTAIQEQLGLRLRSQKAPVEVLVIDHAEKPSEN
jgi:uncharacterized protein (TIGR03435 family)